MSTAGSQCEIAEPRPALAGRRVLIVDGDESIRSSASALLARYGCEVVGVASGAEALTVVSERGASGAFDAILTALRLPDMSGVILMHKLQSLEMPVPLALMCSFGYDVDAILVPARRAGLRFTIYKPFVRKQLLDAVERLAVPPPGGELRSSRRAAR
jgi:CheY-like chemotaxis protein